MRKVKSKKSRKSMPGVLGTLQECQNEYLLTAPKKDSAEQTHVYLTFHVKKPTRILVCVFMQQLDHMNTYLPYLPCLKDSDVATPKIEYMNWPFSQYELRGPTGPQSHTSHTSRFFA